MNKKYIIQKLSEPNEYKDCYVAFLDILGFKEFCKDERSDCAIIKALFDDTELIVSKYNKTFAKLVISQDTIDNSQLMIMSDSIVISAPNSDEGLLSILYQGAFIQNMLLKFGLLVRGGIARGKFFQYKRIMFGPAMIQAYEIESDAKFPRVVLSDDIIDRLKEKGFFKTGNIQKYLSFDDDSIQIQIELLIKQDNDKKYFLNYLSPFETIKIYNDEDLKNNIEKTITKGLKAQDTKVKKKYEWFNTYYNKSITLLEPPKLSSEEIDEIARMVKRNEV